MAFLSHPHIPGGLPLFISAKARMHLQQLHRDGVTTAPSPLVITGDDSLGTTTCLSVVSARGGALLSGAASIYLEDFGISPSEAAQDIAIVNLARAADAFATTGATTVRGPRCEGKSFVSFAR
jgi:hypothetical protein